MTRALFEIIRFLIFIIWAVIGLIFWFPFLIRMIAFFTGSVLVSVGGKTDMSIAQQGLDRAVRFHPDGFTHIHSSINNLINNLINKNIVESKNWNPKVDFWEPLIKHIAFTFLFWVVNVVAYMKFLEL